MTPETKVIIEWAKDWLDPEEWPKDFERFCALDQKALGEQLQIGIESWTEVHDDERPAALDALIKIAFERVNYKQAAREVKKILVEREREWREKHRE